MIGFRRADLKVTVSTFTRVFLFFVNLQLLKTAQKKFRKFIIKEQLWNFIYQNWPNGNLKSEKFQDVDIPMMIEVKALEELTIEVVNEELKLTQEALSPLQSINYSFSKTLCANISQPVFTFQHDFTEQNPDYTLELSLEEMRVLNNGKEMAVLKDACLNISMAYCRMVALIQNERYVAQKYLSVDMQVTAKTLKLVWSLQFYEWMLVLMKYGKLLDITSDLPKHSLKYAKQRYFGNHPESPRANMVDFQKKDKDQFKIKVKVGQGKGVVNFLQQRSEMLFQIDHYTLEVVVKTWADLEMRHSAQKIRIKRAQSLTPTVKIEDMANTYQEIVKVDGQRTYQFLSVCQEAKLFEVRINMEDMFGIAADLGHYDLIQKYYSADQEEFLKWRPRSQRFDAKIFTGLDLNINLLIFAFQLDDEISTALRLTDMDTVREYKKDVVFHQHYYCKRIEFFTTRHDHIQEKKDQLHRMLQIYRPTYELIVLKNSVTLILKVNQAQFHDFQETNLGYLLYHYKRVITFFFRYMKQEWAAASKIKLAEGNQKNKSKTPVFIRVHVDRFRIIFEDSLIAKHLELRKRITENQKLSEKLANHSPDSLRQLQKLSKDETKLCIIDARFLDFRLEIPDQLLDLQFVYNKLVRGLDEAKQRPPFENFRDLQALNMSIETQELKLRIRRYEEPFILFKHFYFRFKLVNAELKAEQGILYHPVENQFFEKYTVHGFTHQVEPKLYYDVKLTASKLESNMHGFDQFHSFLEVIDYMEKFQLKDIHKGVSIQAPTMAGFSHTDELRYRVHGKLDINVDAVEVHYFSPPTFDRTYDDCYLELTMKGFFFKQVGYEMQLLAHKIILNLIAPALKNYDTSSIVSIPQVELILRITFNHTPAIDHYTHYMVKDQAELDQRLDTFKQKFVHYEIKLNIPSLRPADTMKYEGIGEKEVLLYFIEHSNVPLLHFQHCMVPFFMQFLVELVEKKSFTKKKKKGKGQTSSVVYLMDLRALLSDFIVILTDYSAQVEQVKQSTTVDLDFQLLDKDAIKKSIFESANIPIDQSSQESKFTYEDDDIESYASFFHAETYKPNALKQKKSEKLAQDKYLQKFRGIILSLENASLQTECEIMGQEDDYLQFVKKKAVMCLKNSRANCDFLVGSYLNVENLMCIRHHNFEMFRMQNIAESFDYLPYFCDFFRLSIQQYKDSPFRSLFPAYTASLGITQQAPMEFPNQKSSSHWEDFRFKSDDKILVAVKLGYHQNSYFGKHNLYDTKEETENDITEAPRSRILRLNSEGVMQMYDLKEEEEEELKEEDKMSRSPSKGNPSQGDFVELNQNIAKHYIFAKGLRALYTRKVHDLVKRHFTFEKRKKRFKIKKQKQNLFEETAEIMKEGEQEEEAEEYTEPHFYKEVLVFVQVEAPQVNLQNEVKCSQLLLNSADESIYFLLWDYFSLREPYKRELDLRFKKGVKKSINIRTKKMQAHVAPTTIDLNKPTSWLSNRSKILKKIFDTEDIEFLFQIASTLKACELYKMADNKIQIRLGELQGSLNNQTLWELVNVLEAILFDRFDEEQREQVNSAQQRKEYKVLGPQGLQAMLIQRLDKLRVSSIGQIIERLYLKKLINYEICHGQVDLFDYHISSSPFASIRVQGAKGRHYLYSDHSGKIEIDIQQIQIFNKLVDGAPAVLTYLVKPPATHFSEYNIMVRVRLKDEYIVPYEAQWRVFNQFEIFLHPIIINATKKLYKIVKGFFFSRPGPRELEEEDEDETIGDTQKHQSPKKKKQAGIPVYFKYFRINSISTLATFTGGFPKLTNFQVDIPAFAKKGKFRSIKRMFEKYEMFIIKVMLSPNKVGKFLAHKLGIPQKKPKKETEEQRVKRIIDGKSK